MTNTTYNEIQQKLTNNPVERLRMASDPASFFGEFGVDHHDYEKLQREDAEQLTRLLEQVQTDSAHKVVVTPHYWGFSISFNEALTKKIVTGAMDASELAALISGGCALAGVTLPLTMGALVIAAALLLEKSLIELADNGKGVTFRYNAIAVAATSGLSMYVPHPN